MPQKASTHIFKNMIRDVNPMSTNPSSLYNALNIRFTSDNEQTFGSITNEKGTKLIDDINISGTYLSHYIVDNNIMLFTLQPSIIPDYDGYDTNIYRIKLEDDTWTTTLVAGPIDLNMDSEHPLEFTSYYEGEDVVKIYWVDGKNQLRFMNIYGDYTNATDNDFNVLPTLQLEEIVNVEQINGNGIFPAGVIQYAFTYINKLGAESNIFYVTKLKSIQYEDRAGHPQRTINCCFKITIENLDTSFDYVRCYQLIRTTLDEQPVCKILSEVPVNKNENGKITIIDTNIGATYDATTLLFPKYPIIPYTLEQKSNTLFLGNIKETPLDVTDEDIDKIRRYFNKRGRYERYKIINDVPTVVFEFLHVLRFDNFNGETYECLDKDGYIINTDADVIRTFKSRETYRIGVQLQDKYGCWTEPIYLQDIDVNCKQKQEGTNITPISLIFDVSKAGEFPELSKEFKRFRFLMVNPTTTDRETFAQGFVVPTLYEASDREDNSPFSYNSWYVRPQCGGIEFRHQFRLPDIVTNGTAGETVNYFGNPIFDRQGTQPSQDTTTTDVSFTIEFLLRRDANAASQQIGRTYVSIADCYVTSKTVALVTDGIGTNYKKGVGRNYTTIPSTFGKAYTLTDSDKSRIASEFVTYVRNESKLNNTIQQHIVNQLWSQLPSLIYNQLLLQDMISKKNPMEFTTTKITLQLQNVDVTDFNYGPTSVDNSMDNQTCNFHIDHSILNLYSPTIDDDYYVLDNNKLEFDLIGYSNISKINENIFVSIKQTGASPRSCVESRNNIINITNTKLYNVNSKFLYYDTIVSQKVDNDGQTDKNFNNYLRRSQQTGNLLGPYHISYLIAPWHKPNFNNDDNTFSDFRSSLYDRKVFARMFTTNSTQYFNNLKLSKSINSYEEITESEYQQPDILKVCNNTVSLKTFVQDGVLRTYLSNVDIARSFAKNEYEIPVLDILDDNNLTTVTGIDTIAQTPNGRVGVKDTSYKGILKSSDPMQIKYISDTHILIPFNRQDVEVDGDLCRCFFRLPNLSSEVFTYENSIQPTGRNSRGFVSQDEAPVGPYYPSWDTYHRYIDYDCYAYDNEDGEEPERIITENPYVFIAELHREVSNKYGGKIAGAVSEPPETSILDIYDRNDSVLLSNIYIPISESINIGSLDEYQIFSTTYGDTWYGRWDCLKTQEMTADDQQSIHDYISVMIESHMNLNGRYDEYRNYYDWTIVNAELANKFNPVYSQLDNFWQYKVEPSYIKSKTKPNQITWSLTKQSGSLVDEWTKVTEAAVYEMDGTKGSVNKIINYKDNLIIFQDKCFSQLLYNEQMQMSTAEGVPVEISNSNKVTGKRVLFENTGCVNKWSICSTQDALFFIDNYNKGIFAYSPESKDNPLTNLTAAFGFDTFMKKENSLDVWNPEDFSNFVTLQDNLRKDVYFINKNNCLAYSSLLNGFTSFYSYEETPAMFNYQDKFFSIKNDFLYELFADKYNNIYDTQQPSIIEFIDTGQQSDQDGGSVFADKTFTTLSYIQDAFDVSTEDGITEDYIGKDYTYLPERTFNTLKVHTPFQDTGTINLESITSDGSESNLQRKFRTWNITIPRCASTLFNSDELDRIRNNWAKFTLTFRPDSNENTKIELFGINIYNLT